MEEFNDGNYLISTDKLKIDVLAVHDFLSKHSTWSKDIPIENVKTAIENSLNFGLFHKGKQIGYGRVISDFSTIAYLGDVYILDAYRGNGLSHKLLEAIMNHSSLQGLRRWILISSSAKWLYKKYGFTPVEQPEWYMELYNKKIYQK